MSRVAIFCCVLLMVPALARAQDQEPDPVAEARREFLHGTRLAKEGVWQEALGAFERSNAIREHALTIYDIAYCERALGHHTRAWVMFERALARQDESGAAELPADFVESARVYSSEAEAKLARARVRVPAGASLSVDGEPLTPLGDGRMAAGIHEGSSASPPATFELIADPGAHRFVLVNANAERTLVTGDNGTLDFDALDAAEHKPAPVAPARARPAAGRPASVDYVGPVAAYAVGAAGLVVGGVFGVRALNEQAELDAGCWNRTCPPAYRDRIARAQADALTSTIGFGVGVAGALVGTCLLPARSDPDIAPEVGAGWLGARGRF